VIDSQQNEMTDSTVTDSLAEKDVALTPETWWAASQGNDQEYCYYNAATCPDCSAGMIRLGGCFSCPSCGFESCSY
jgi:hypothetical protein